jgi:hypothetical protein
MVRGICNSDRYSTAVRTLTEIAYVEHFSEINPKNLTRGLGFYDLDHILSIHTCFEWGVPVSFCADYRNLQMLTGPENKIKGISIPDIIPIIFESFQPVNINTSDYGESL